MQGFIQDFVFGEVRKTFVGDGSGHRKVVVRMAD